MERRKAIIASALAAVGLTIGAGVYVAGSGLLAGATDNVGNLEPTATTTAPPAVPQEITVYVDPATGSATTVGPRASVVEAPSSGATAPASAAVDDSDAKSHDDEGADRDDDHHGDDREDAEHHGEEDD